MAKAKSAVPEGHHTVTPQLTLDNAAQAIDWYKKALGAEEVARATGPDGKIMHAEVRIGDSRIMLNDAMMGGKAPKRSAVRRLRSGSMWRIATRCSTAPWRRARRSPAGPWGRWRISSGAIAAERSPTRRGTWTIATHKEDLTPEEMEQRQAEWMKQFAPQPTHN